MHFSSTIQLSLTYVAFQQIMFLQTHAITNTDLLKNNSLIYSTFVT